MSNHKVYFNNITKRKVKIDIRFVPDDIAKHLSEVELEKPEILKGKKAIKTVDNA